MKGSQRRQTRLAFTPLPSSSPAAKGYNKQIQDRAAAVSLHSSPRSSKRKDIGNAKLHGVSESMPTPVATLEQNVLDDADSLSQSDSEPIRSAQRKQRNQRQFTSRRIQQQPLDFASTRDANTFSSPIRLPSSSSSKPQSSTQAGMFSTQPPRPIVGVSSDESGGELPSPAKLIAKKKSKRVTKINNNSEVRLNRSTRQMEQVNSGSDGDNIIVNSGQPKVNDEESEDDDDDMPTTIGAQRRKRARRPSRSSSISFSPPRAVESDDELEIVDERVKRRRREEEDSDEAEVEEYADPQTPSRRKSKRSREKIQQEKDDLAEDLNDLGPSSDIESCERKPRNTQTAQKDARQHALDKLKRRRSGQAANGISEDEGEDEGFDRLYKSKGDQLHPMSSRQMFGEDEDDQNFVDEDEDEQLGAPEGLPLEFTRYASMKPKELFKHAVEWFVQKKINPAFEKDDPIYDLTFRKLDDEVKGLAGSKFKSAAWTSRFTISLNSRPDIAYEPIDRTSAEHFMLDKCDACNRSQHPATYQIHFQGDPYSRETLEELPGDDGDDESSSENEGRRDKNDEPSWDEDGLEIPPANTIFYVGKFCMGNAQTAHSLQHWRYHLNEWVVTWLTANGYDTAEKIVERDRLSTKRRRKEANKIVDRMEQGGVVKTLWRDFRQNIDNARNSKQGRYSSLSP